MIKSDVLEFSVSHIEKKIGAINEGKSKSCFHDCYYKIRALFYLKIRINTLNDKYCKFIKEKIMVADFSRFEKGDDRFAYKFFPSELVADFESMLFHAKAFLDYLSRAISFHFNPNGTPPGNIERLLGTLKNNYKDKAKEIIALFEDGAEYTKYLNGLTHRPNDPPDLDMQSYRDASTHYEKPELYFYIYEENGLYLPMPEEALLDIYNEKHKTLSPSSNVKIKSIAENIYSACFLILIKTLDVLWAADIQGECAIFKVE